MIISRRGRYRLFILCSLVLGLSAFGPECQATPYDNAVRNSPVFEAGHIEQLVTIPANEANVTVVTWATRATADAYYPLGQAQVGVDVWVTKSPQLQQMCEHYSHSADNLRLRLQQVLGLPPQVEDRVFVVMQVARGDLFRPCPDPDPAQPTCGSDFPGNVSTEHKAWMGNQFLQRYRLPGGYPWTHLGYTYDWGGATTVGASEFVVRRGATVTVTAKSETAAYCHP